jgi:hypothetical protein
MTQNLPSEGREGRGATLSVAATIDLPQSSRRTLVDAMRGMTFSEVRAWTRSSKLAVAVCEGA